MVVVRGSGFGYFIRHFLLHGSGLKFEASEALRELLTPFTTQNVRDLAVWAKVRPKSGTRGQPTALRLGAEYKLHSMF